MEPLNKHMTDRLRAYATSYEEEAWEDFERFRAGKKRRPLLLFLRIAAGILILGGVGVSAYKFFQKDYQPTRGTSALNQKTQAAARSGQEEHELQSSSPVAGEKFVTKQNKPPGSVQLNENLTLVPVEVSRDSEAEEATEVYQPQNITFNADAFLPVRTKKLFISYRQKEDNDVPEKPHKEVRLSVAIASQSNQADNYIPEQSFGLRGATEIALNRKVAVGTGIYVGRESLHLRTGNVPDPSSVGQAILHQVNYSWVNVEVPLTFRYKLLQNRSFGISTQAGVSLMGALGQTSQLSYENKRTIVLVSVGENGEMIENANTVTEKEVIRTSENAGKFSLGTALNLSVGIHYPLGKNQLSVEPFFKYPLGSVTFEKLNFSSVGVQLRWTGAVLGRKASGEK